ncbi:MAG TPA: RES domain-containing protein [Thermoanaerobaculia bacterium]|nr:RES domain-containing protein [Thermoanaerobaculia bacterium]
MTSLREPPSDLGGFPGSLVPGHLLRVCRKERATWWFSSDGSGRFDLAPPEGTCYLATDAYAAVREASRLGPVTPGWVLARELRTVSPPDPTARLAATTRQAAGRFGLTTELATILPYDLPRRWAVAFRRRGFAGIRHELRHDQRARPSGIALFGSAGAPAWSDGKRQRLGVAMVESFGVAVLPLPLSTVLTIVD